MAKIATKMMTRGDIIIGWRGTFLLMFVVLKKNLSNGHLGDVASKTPKVPKFLLNPSIIYIMVKKEQKL